MIQDRPEQGSGINTEGDDDADVPDNRPVDKEEKTK
jgi:hypothetical protein